ncbi:MAG: ATP-binding/permease protein CydD [Anaerolineae bacterium]|nr:ATP-binding/permease protein CydD [Anaerolineae bacterium]RIK33791.1 MAG: thiol reductant ABC exporter subunit CydD [Chloroflexota bacterium]
MSVERRILQENRPARTRLYGAVGFSFGATALWLAIAALLSATVDRVFLQQQTLAETLPLLGAMLLLMFLRAGLMWASEILAQLSANRVKRTLRARVTEKLFALGPLYTRDERAGELVHTATAGVETLDEYISQFQPARWLAALTPALVLSVILILDPWTLPILLFTGPILLALLALIGKRTRDVAAQRFQEMAWMSAFFLDMLQGIATLKLFGRSREQAATIETISRQYGNTTMQVLGTAFQTSLVLEWGATAATALVAIEVSVRLMGGFLPLDRALTVLLLTPEFFLPLRQLALKYHAGATGKAAAERIYAILDTPHAPSSVRFKPSVHFPRRAPCDIFFDDVYVAYDNGARPALNGLTLEIKAGQTVALVGATGAGKTTVANLLLRFVEPTRGKIRVDAIELNEIEPSAWRARVSWAPQHPYLFAGTALENLRFAKPTATEQEIFDAARAAHAHEFIMQLPRGYDTPLGERGARLSGGQSQRLALARALLKDAPILIFDEGASYLDAESEKHIRAALAALKQRRTVLVIAHRLALAHDADVIAVMQNGRVVEGGPPDALAARGAMYAALRAAYAGGAA